MTVQSNAPTVLTSDQQKQWLKEHIPHRIRAVLPGLPMQGLWRIHWKIGIISSQAGIHCMHNAIWEGRLTAIRWLIMFVGVAEKNGKAVPFSLKHPQSDVRIDRFNGGKLFDAATNNALKLALVWKGCSQATSHPTQGTKHPPVNEPQLAEALTIIIDHLDQTIYAKNGLSLLHETMH